MTEFKTVPADAGILAFALAVETDSGASMRFRCPFSAPVNLLATLCGGDAGNENALPKQGIRIYAK